MSTRPGATCAAGGPVATFDLKITGGRTFCDASGCGGGFLAIHAQDGTPLDLGGICPTSCSDCMPRACPNSCRAPSVIGANGVSQQWTGTYYATLTCGSGTQCEQAKCVSSQGRLGKGPPAHRRFLHVGSRRVRAHKDERGAV